MAFPHLLSNSPRAGRLLAGAGLAAALTVSACAPAPAAPTPRPAPAPKVVANANCSVPTNTPVRTLIQEVFSCELTKAGVPASQVSAAAKQADGVAWCESRYRNGAIAYGGKYLNSPHPSTGYRYSAAGLFQIIRSTADAYVPGGYAKVHDPIANTRGAATIWLWGHNRNRNPWAPWSCAPGTTAYNRAAAER